MSTVPPHMKRELVPQLSRVSFSSFDDILSSLDDLEQSKPRQGPVHHKAALKVKTPDQPVSPEIGNSHMCNKCHTKILVDKVSAEGKQYHPTCFTCTNCGVKLLGSFFPRSGENYCVNCVENLNPCGTCGKVIYSGTKFSIDGEGTNHHPECFVDKKGCAKCHKPVMGIEVKALDKVFHPDCFRCVECNQLLDGTFVNVNGNTVCVGCRSGKKPKCESCQKPLLKDFSEFRGKMFHTECFVCTKCKKVIGLDPFFDVAGQPVCQNCDVWRTL